MAKKKGRAKAAVKRAGAALRSGMSTRPGQVLMAAGMAAAGGVATSMIVNNVPKVKDMGQTTKSAIQGGLGLAAIMFGKQKWMKGLGAGAVVAAVFGIVKDVVKVNPLAGPGAGTPTLTAAQMKALMNGDSMGVPGNVRMNRPADVTMRGNSPIQGTQAQGWGSGWN